MTHKRRKRGRRAQHPEEPQSGLPPEEEWEPAANLGAVGEWYEKAAVKEQEEREGKTKAFEPGEEGIEEVLGE